MKQANLTSLLSAASQLQDDLFKDYLKFHSIRIKKEELDDIKILYDQLKSNSENIKILDKYFIGYSIPQIGKEFDLLRLDEDSIVNIEIKREGNEQKIKKQLILNKHYLSFLGKELHLFSFHSSSGILYQLDQNNDFNQVNITELLAKLVIQENLIIENIDNYFNPSDYLVSPFNSTKKFIQGKYFLTQQQEEIKNDVLNSIKTYQHSILPIKGKAGTGKTLLTYDIAKEVQKNKKVTIIHCGHLNEGHYLLNREFGWDIYRVKSYKNALFSKPDLIIVDECQRIYENQLEKIIDHVKDNQSNCILSFDENQTLRSRKAQANIEKIIKTHVTLFIPELTTKIRTNKEVARFIKCMFNTNERLHKMDYSKIELNYFDNLESAKDYVKQLSEENWKIINYTPDSQRLIPYEQNNFDDVLDNAHKVIGQEFDNVVAIVDQYFYYDDQGKLSTSGYTDKPYYHPTKMLYQIVSRVRIRLSVIVIDNPIILNRCLKILDKSTD